MKKIFFLISLFLLLTAVPAVRVHSDAAPSAPKTPRPKFSPVLVVLDRFEGRFAVVELPDRRMFNLPKALVPQGSSEGSVLRITVAHPGKNRE